MSAACEQHRPGPAARAAARLGGRIPALDTRRLQLRGPRIYDFDCYASILTSDRAQFMGGPLSRAQAWTDFTQYTALWLLHGHGLWTIDAQTRPSAGFVLLGYEYEDPEAELGIFLCEEAEGQGYAEEAMIAARGHAFGELGWDSVVSYVAHGNDRARKLMRKLGAKRDRAAEDALEDGATCVYRHRKEAA
ncbi:GNAT family N-acetyltransferase [Salipiger sp.]|uniref:GNAT family N-acetyltransferase n=1 Tax=Salipiger sp. TaxID=2078585 RepID=UPI003A982A63